MELDEQRLVMKPAPKLPLVIALNYASNTRPEHQSQSLQSITARANEPSLVAVSSTGATFHIAEAHNAFLDAMRRQASLHQAYLAASQRGLNFFTAPVQSANSPRPPPITSSEDEQLVPSQAADAPHPEPSEQHAPSEQSQGPRGPQFDRAQLEILTSGKISSVFGSLFEKQDSYHRQVRMPQPPLLLVDRVTGIEAEAGTQGQGTIWSETEIRHDSWYLHADRMPAGLIIESIQANMMLASWMGVDFLNRGERVYRALGCELTYHGSLPKIGERLCFEIHLDRHLQQGNAPLFLFHCDGRIHGETRVSVRQAQAGFFTEAELAKTTGLTWDPETVPLKAGAIVDDPSIQLEASSFTHGQVIAFSEGRPYDCFGPAFAMTETHTRTPRIQSGDMMLMGEVSHFEPGGGPWGRGYLRSVRQIAADDWFFSSHFKNDPCMPGSLMFEGGIQAMSFFIAAMGCAVDRDGWRFEPVPEIEYQLRCRREVRPTSQTLAFEIFVHEFHNTIEPTLYADILVSVDGLTAFHCRRMGIRLVPDFPLRDWVETDDPVDAAAGPTGSTAANTRSFDHRSLMAGALGAPSRAFGPEFIEFDGTRRLSRLPASPYLFMTRISQVDALVGTARIGNAVTAEYDIPQDAWYFSHNAFPTMPHCILMEAALQPCGWLAIFTGASLRSSQNLFFRNLEGTANLESELLPNAGTLLSRATLTNLSRTGDTTLLDFTVECVLASSPQQIVYRLRTTFGFFPRAALENQVGLPLSTSEIAHSIEQAGLDSLLEASSEQIENLGHFRATGDLSMLQRVIGYWPSGGVAGIGRIQAERDVSPKDWYFKAHFFQDPVQPGSLGIEAMLQLLRYLMIERGLSKGLDWPRFEPIATKTTLNWRYRGQVIPSNHKVTVEIELCTLVNSELGCVATANGWLWVDGKRIYEARGLAMRLINVSSSNLL